MTITETLQSAIAGGTMGALIAGAIVIVILISVGLWVYTSFAWMTIGNKLKYKNSWLAWIPFARTAMVFELGKFHWALVFLWLIPVLGWIAIGVLTLIARWRIFEERKYSGWLALVPILGIIPFLGWLAGIATLIILGFVAWKDM